MLKKSKAGANKAMKEKASKKSSNAPKRPASAFFVFMWFSSLDFFRYYFIAVVFCLFLIEAFFLAVIYVCIHHREEFRKSFEENFPDVKSVSAVRFELGDSKTFSLFNMNYMNFLLFVW